MSAPGRSRVMAFLDRLFGGGHVEPQLELFRAEAERARATAPVVVELIRRLDRYEMARDGEGDTGHDV